MAQERTTLYAQIAALEKQISDDASASHDGTFELRLVFRKEIESMQTQQDEVCLANFFFFFFDDSNVEIISNIICRFCNLLQKTMKSESRG
jgi:hypothetical protein